MAGFSPFANYAYARQIGIMKPQVFGGENASTTRSLRCWWCWRWSFIDTQQEWFLHSTLKFMVGFPRFKKRNQTLGCLFCGHDIKQYRKFWPTRQESWPNHLKSTDFKMVELFYRPQAGMTHTHLYVRRSTPFTPCFLGLYLNPHPFRQQETTQLLQSRE